MYHVLATAKKKIIIIIYHVSNTTYHVLATVGLFSRFSRSLFTHSSVVACDPDILLRAHSIKNIFYSIRTHSIEKTHSIESTFYQEHTQ